MIELILGWAFTICLLLMAYVGIHMVFEKDAGKYIPLVWEKNGLLDKLLKLIRK